MTIDQARNQAAPFNINIDDIKVNLERQDNLDVLEVKIELPDK